MRQEAKGLPRTHRCRASHRNCHQQLPLLRRQRTQGMPDAQRIERPGWTEATTLSQGS